MSAFDRRFARYLPNHDVTTVPLAGWAGIKNGALMRLAESKFDVFITVDRNLSFQQHLPQYKIAVIVIRSISNRVEDLSQFVGNILEILPSVQDGVATIIE